MYALILADTMLFLSTLSLRRATQRHPKTSNHPHNFYPRSPCGERRHSVEYSLGKSDFYPRSPCGERRRHRGNDRCPVHFYPRSPCGERHGQSITLRLVTPFLSTLSLRRATDVIAVMTDAQSISIHALLAESDIHQSQAESRQTISIHALLAESDDDMIFEEQTEQISIHALLAESDLTNCLILTSSNRFLSTLSLRRATVRRSTMADFDKIFLSTLSLRRATCIPGPAGQHGFDFYPRSPCGERHTSVLPTIPAPAISIHALLAESDVSITITITCTVSFLSTLSLRRATAKVHKTVGYFCAYETIFLEIASSC